jgi:hypothetical protein
MRVQVRYAVIKHNPRECALIVQCSAPVQQERTDVHTRYARGAQTAALCGECNVRSKNARFTKPNA